MEPQPIATAPRDGTPILTDEGVCRWMDYHCRTPGWITCIPSGWEPSCADSGYFYNQPTKWVPLPEWMAV